MKLFEILGKIAIEDDEARAAIRNTQSESEHAAGGIEGAFKKIGAAVATYLAVDKIIDFGKSIVDAAATIDAETSAFEQIMGSYTDTARDKLNAVADTTGVMSTRMQGHFTSLSAKFKGLGFDVEDATDLAQRGLTLAADAAAFWDVSLDDSSSHLNSFINGSYEGGEAIGLFANDTQMAMYAVQQGIVGATKDWSTLDEATKQATRLEYAENMYAQSGATGQAAREADQYANVQANLTEKWRQFKAQIGEPLLQNIVLPAMEKLSGLVDLLSQKFENLKTWISENQETIQQWKDGFLLALQILSPLIIGLTAGFLAYNAALLAGKAIHAVSSAATFAYALATGQLTTAQIAAKLAQMGLNAAMLMSPITWIVALIVGLVAAFVLLWNKCEGFRNFWTGLWDGIKEVFSAVVDWFSEKFEAVKNFFGGLADKASEIKDKIGEKFGEMKEAISEKVSAMKESVSEKFDAIKEKMGTVMQAAKDTVNEKLQNMKDAYNEHGGGIKGIAASAIEGVKGFYTSGFTFINNLTGGKLGEVVDKFKNKMEAAKQAVSDKISNIKNKFSEGLNNAKDTVSNILTNIKDNFSEKLNAAKNTVSGAIDKIKGFFKFEWSLPKLKLPHFSISGEFSLNPLSVPSLAVDWYANGGILQEPTIFGFNPKTGNAQVGGEAGPEAVAPIETLLSYVKTAVQEENAGLLDVMNRTFAILAEYLPGIPEIANMQMVTDTGALVGALAPTMDSRLGDINRLRGRGQ